MNAFALHRGMLRAAWRMKGRLIAAGLIMGSALAMFAGVYSAIDSLFASRDAWYRELDAADLELRIVPDDVINLPSLDRVPGVAAVDRRLVLPGNVDIPGGGKLYALMVAKEPEARINRLRIDAGSGLDPTVPTGAVIERTMARHYGYKLGDPFVLHVGKDRYELTVRGIATSPEFLIDGANPNFFLPSKGSLGVVYVPYSLIEPRLGYQLVSSLLIDAADGADIRSVEQGALSALGRKVTVDESLPLARQFGHLFLELDLGAFKLFVPAIVLIFVITALVITVFLLAQWITEKRAEIGVMMALGYRARDVVTAFAMPALAIGVIALASGTLLSFALLYGFGIDYAKALGLPPPTLGLRPERLLQGYAGLLATLAVATVIPLRAILSMTPREALRGTARSDEVASGIGAGRPQGRVQRSIAWRYATRDLRRGKLLALMSVTAVGLSIGASLAHFVALDSFERSIVDRFAADDWDLAVDFLAPVWQDELSDLQTFRGVTRTDPYLRGAIKLRHGDRVEPSLLLGIEPTSAARRLRIVEGTAIGAGDRDAIVLERKTAAALGVAAGDTVTVLARDRSWTVRVAGLFTGVLPGESYAALADVQSWFDMADQVTGAFLKAGPSVAADSLYRIDRVARVTAKGQLIERFVAHLTEIAAIVWLAFGFSLVVAVLFLFSTTAYGVLRRLGEYATLRTLGFSDASVLRMIVAEVAVIGAIGTAVALLVGIATATGLNSVLSRAWFQVDTTVAPGSLLAVLLPVLILFPMTALPPFRSIIAAGLVPTLRRRAVG